MRFLFFLIITAFFFSLPAWAQTSDESKKLNSMLESYFEDILKLYPIYATQIGDSRYDDRFENDIGEEHRAKAKGVYDRYLKALSGIDRSRLIGQDRLSYDQFKFETELR